MWAIFHAFVTPVFLKQEIEMPMEERSKTHIDAYSMSSLCIYLFWVFLVVKLLLYEQVFLCVAYITMVCGSKSLHVTQFEKP